MTTTNDEEALISEETAELDDVELNISKRKEKYRFRRRLLMIGVLAVVVAIATIIIVVVVSRPQVPLREFTFDDIFNPNFTIYMPAPQFYMSYAVFYDAHTDSIVGYDLGSNPSKEKEKHTFLTASDVLKLNNSYVPSMQSFSISPDGKGILIPVNVEKIWRHSFTAQYALCIRTQHTQLEFQCTDLLNEHEHESVDKLSAVLWSPDSEKIAFVDGNNDVYIVSISNLTLAPSRISFDGKRDKSLVNGIYTWVYEEEISSSSNAMWWSKDGSKLAYMKSDQSTVPEMRLDFYDGVSQQYPRQFTYHYPKPGYENAIPTTSVVVHDVHSNVNSSIQLQSSTYDYLANVGWVNETTLYVRALDRMQTRSSLLLCAAASGECKSIREQTTGGKGWLSFVPGTPRFIGSNTDCFIDGEINDSDLLVLARYVIDNEVGAAKRVEWLGSDMKGPATALVGLGVRTPLSALSVYFETAFPTPRDRQIVRHSAGQSTPILPCRSEGCFYSMDVCEIDVDADPSVDVKHIVIADHGPSIPSVKILSYLDPVQTIVESNSIARNAMKDVELPIMEDVNFTTTTTVMVNGRLWKPAKTKSKNAYLINVYGGPGSQTASHEFSQLGFNAYLVSLGITVASFDGRGTGFREESWSQCVYKQLGLLESEDQIAAAKWLKSRDKVKDVDAKVGIWGWSYGGYMTLMSLAEAMIKEKEPIFTAGASVAPVTDWRFYDAAYTERYMAMPSAADNVAGYDKSSVLSKDRIEALTKCPLFLAAGLTDDNVHYQNTAELTKELVSKSTTSTPTSKSKSSSDNFETISYPNNDHSLRNGGARRNVYERIANHVEKYIL